MSAFDIIYTQGPVGSDGSLQPHDVSASWLPSRRPHHRPAVSLCALQACPDHLRSQWRLERCAKLTK